MGVESWWRQLKVPYRKEVTKLLSRGATWNQERLVRKLILETDDEAVKKMAMVGLDNITKAVPVDPRVV